MFKTTEKINGYSVIRVSSAVILTLLLVTASCAISLNTNAANLVLLNNPPYEPSNPTPANGSTNVSLPVILNWTGGDPDGDNVTYTVFFEADDSTPDVLVSENQTETTYDPGVLNLNTTYYWQIIAWDNHSACTMGPIWNFETRENHPPNMPSSPSPANNSIDESFTVDLTWTGGDPDSGDTVTYDVFFGITSSPPKVVSNQSGTSYDPGTLDFNTVYYWQIIAWDNHNSSMIGPLWQFTTKIEELITVSISQPLEKSVYFQGEKRKRLNPSQRTIIYGAITIIANATADVGVKKVDFYIDGKLENTSTSEPYNITWNPIIQFNGLSLQHTIMVVATDINGNNATAQINVTKWRFHPLLVGAGLLAIASLVNIRLIPRTTVTGLVFNYKDTGREISFFALRIKYTSSGPLKSESGVIRFQRCTMTFPTGPKAIFQFGPLHSFALVSLTCLGKIHYGPMMSSQDAFQELFKNRSDRC